MRRIRSAALFCCGMIVSGIAAELPVYPSAGGLNLRVPVIAPVAGGAVGKRVPFEMVHFTYDLTPHLAGLAQGEVSLWVQDSLRRTAKEVVSLSGPAGELKISIPAAPSQARRFRLESGNGHSDSRGVQTPGEWKKLSLSWGGGRAGLTLENGETLSVKLPETFTVERLRCQASLVDELSRGEAAVSLSTGRRITPVNWYLPVRAEPPPFSTALIPMSSETTRSNGIFRLYSCRTARRNPGR